MTTAKRSELLAMITGLTRKYHSEYERAEAYRELSVSMMRRVAKLESALAEYGVTAEDEEQPGDSSLLLADLSEAAHAQQEMFVFRIETPGQGTSQAQKTLMEAQ